MSLLPAYMSESFKSYEQMANEDRSLMDHSLVSASPESCHKNLLPFLAWESDADISGLDETTSRKVIRAAFDAQQYAGTAKALIGTVEALSDVVEVKEWFEYGGPAYNFRVEINASQNGLSSNLIQALEKTAAKNKNVRSVLDSIKISMLSTSTMHHALTCQSGESVLILPYSPNPIEEYFYQFSAAALHAVETTIIYPLEGA